MPPIKISFVTILSLSPTSVEVPINTRELSAASNTENVPSVETLPDGHPSLTDQNSQTAQTWPNIDSGMALSTGTRGDRVSPERHEMEDTEETWRLISEWLIPKLLEEGGKGDATAKSAADGSTQQLLKRDLDDLREQIYKGLGERGESEEHSRMLAKRALPQGAQNAIEIVCGLGFIVLVWVGYCVYVSYSESRRRGNVSRANHGQNTRRRWHGRPSGLDPATDPQAHALRPWMRLRPRLVHAAPIRATEIQDPPRAYDPKNSNGM